MTSPTISLAAFFPRLPPRLPAAWAAALEPCRRRAEAFRCDAMAVLELPLGGATAAFDFSVRLEEAEQCLEPAALPAAAAGVFAARRAGELPRAWLPAIWLEYDLRQDPGRPPITCFRLGAEAPIEWIGGDLLPRLGFGLPPAALAAAAAALARLPTSARPLYLFDLGARGRPALRCELAAEPESLAGWLVEIGATEQAASLERLAALWRAGDQPSADQHRGDRPHVSLNFDGAWLPRIGLENSFRGQPPGEERWRRQLDFLAEQGLALPAETGWLLAWPGVETPGQPGWPADAAGRPLPGWLVACLSHLKLARAPGAGIEAKAYLLFQYLAREVRTWPSR